jgi:hypothetical protein
MRCEFLPPSGLQCIHHTAPSGQRLWATGDPVGPEFQISIFRPFASHSKLLWKGDGRHTVRDLSQLVSVGIVAIKYLIQAPWRFPVTLTWSFPKQVSVPWRYGCAAQMLTLHVLDMFQGPRYFK